MCQESTFKIICHPNILLRMCRGEEEGHVFPLRSGGKGTWPWGWLLVPLILRVAPSSLAAKWISIWQPFLTYIIGKIIINKTHFSLYNYVFLKIKFVCIFIIKEKYVLLCTYEVFSKGNKKTVLSLVALGRPAMLPSHLTSSLRKSHRSQRQTPHAPRSSSPWALPQPGPWVFPITVWTHQALCRYMRQSSQQLAGLIVPRSQRRKRVPHPDPNGICDVTAGSHISRVWIAHPIVTFKISTTSWQRENHFPREQTGKFKTIIKTGSPGRRSWRHY